jgi:UDP-4-amino-4,6-dideoxy-N-acetyl-beta-L-altrosamine transaminase
MISYGKQTIDKLDIDAVIEVLQGGWLTQGPYVTTFENDLKNYFGSDYCTVVSNGTAALHLAGLALGWKEDDIILTTPITFLASANCALYSKARPDFVDINATSFNIEPDKLDQKIISLLSQGNNVKAIVAVDYAGNPCDWAALRRIADQYKLQLINDNCHALGAEYKGSKGYAIENADIVIQSYHPVKHITCGEGGAVFTNNKNLDTKIRTLRSHGMKKDSLMFQENEGSWYYEMQELGYNYRLTDIQSALGSSQLKKLDEFVRLRQSIARLYDHKFSNIDHIQIPCVNSDSSHSYHLYPLQIEFDKYGLSRKLFFEKMKEAGIILQVHYIPVHLQPYYREKYGFGPGDYPVSEKFYSKQVSLPIYPNLSKSDQIYVIDTLKGILGIENG